MAKFHLPYDEVLKMPVDVALLALGFSHEEINTVLKTHLHWYRWLGYQAVLLSPDVKKGNKPKSIESYYPFPWDQDKRKAIKPKFSKEEAAEVFKKLGNGKK